jgi:hypothetical protein
MTSTENSVGTKSEGRSEQKDHPIRGEGEPVWHRLGDKLPDEFRPLLIASKQDDEDFWRVRDANLQLRYEGAFPSLDDLKDGKTAYTWWFDSIYPGKGDMRLAHADVLWRYMPTPDDAHPPTTYEGEGLREKVERLREWMNELPIPTEGIVPQLRNVDSILQALQSAGGK